MINNISSNIIKFFFGEIVNFLGSLSLGEFMLIWVSALLLVFFCLFLLFNIIQIKKGTNLLKVNVKKILYLLKNGNKFIIDADE